MEDGKITDKNLKASVGNDVKNIRLNGKSAWCFKGTDLKQRQPVTVTIDLGQLTFVSGIKTQGPPESLKQKEYRYSVGFYIENSTQTENSLWEKCCGGNSKTFYAEDKPSEIGIIKTHSFEMLVLARQMRFTIPHGVKWIGDDENCFRIELLGCRHDLSPQSNLKIEALPSGWIEATWDNPSVIVPRSDKSELMELDILRYEVNMTMSEESGKVKPQNFTTYSQRGRRVLIPGPIWGARYSVNVLCLHQGQVLPCGSEYVVASVGGCNPSDSSCEKQNQVIFRRPQHIKSWTIRPSKSKKFVVFLSWDEDGPGWVTTASRITVHDSNKRELLNDLINNEIRSIRMTDLSGRYFNITFTPEATSLRYTPIFSYDLHIAEWKLLESTPSKEGSGAFVSDVNLEVDIHWEGKLLVSWTSALVQEADLIRKVVNGKTENAINKSTEFTAKALQYNVTLVEENEGFLPKFNVISGDEELKTTFSNLKLESFYIVNIICDFGGLVFKCGFYPIYTSLPMFMEKFKSHLQVYVGHPAGESWHKQEENCRKGHGTLVSLDTKEEEELVSSEVKRHSSSENFKSFWIGLNMCPSNEGEAWSDGSRGTYNLLPERGLTLGIENCCIKTVWQGTISQFIWDGENCTALLPALCEYKISGLVGEISNLERLNASRTAAAYQWDYKEEYWMSSVFTHVICPVRYLWNPTELITGNKVRCIIKVSSVDETSFTIAGLEEFVEYSVTVSGSLPSLGFNGKNQTIKIRTYYNDSAIIIVLGAGYIQAIWAEKVSNFEENGVVKATLFRNSEKISSFESKAESILFDGLKMGSSYKVVLEDLSGTKGTIEKHLIAYPPCQCKNCQYLGMCFASTDKQIPKSVALSQCEKEEKTLAVSKTKESLEVLLQLAESVVDDLWISSSSVKGKGESFATTAVFQDQNNSRSETTTSDECLLVSRSSRSIIVASDCLALHYAACEKKSPMSSVFPSLDKINSKIGGTWIEFDWNASSTGWLVDYTLYYGKDMKKKDKREAPSYIEFKNPPVVAENLERDTEYWIEIIADLGEGFIDSKELKAKTTLSTSKYQRQMSAEWSASKEYFLAQLICGTFLIVSCITTMLLFFATGMFYQDCMAQLGFLFCLLVSYALLLFVHPPYVDEENETLCIVVAALLHYFFSASFLFLCLEALTISYLMVEKIKSPFQNSNWLLMLTGFFLPLLYVSITAGILNTRYASVPRHVCWVNLGDAPLYVETIPNGLIFIITLILILATLKTSEDNQPVLKDNDIRGRQSDSFKLRWVVLALIIELGFAWSAGVYGYYFESSSSQAIHDVFIILLALTILFGRTWLDDTFRTKIHRLCCGTELTYKRSAIKSISARTRVGPATEVKPKRLPEGSSTKGIQVSRSARSISVAHTQSTSVPSQPSVSSRRFPLNPPSSNYGRMNSAGGRPLSTSSLLHSENESFESPVDEKEPLSPIVHN